MKTQFLNPTRLEVTGKNLVIESTGTGVVISEPNGDTPKESTPRKGRGPAKPKTPAGSASEFFGTEVA